MHKRIVILDHNRGRLANQLWNFMSMYAYCLEKGYELENRSFFDYAEFFTLPLPRSFFVKFFFFGRWTKQKWYRRWRPYDRYLALAKNLFRKRIVSSGAEHPFYLPPSPNQNRQQLQTIARMENSASGTIYAHGWLFRNPAGIEKYRRQIAEYFRPRKAIAEQTGSFLAALRKDFTHIVGVHIRQTDYKQYAEGQYFFTQEEVKKMLDGYLRFSGRNNDDTVFVLCSDGPIDQSVFTGLRIALPRGTAVEDLFTLAGTDIVIGSNSTYGAFASYYGNIPFIVFERDGIEWEYYRGKNGYFENKKNTLVHY